MNDLTAWKNKETRKPLILKGARQVGKTWLLKRFGELHFEDVAYFNFDLQQDIKSFFEQTKEPVKLIEYLSIVRGRRIIAGTSLLILDEIQECNPALNSLKYFKELMPEMHVVAAGSLLGVTMARGSSFPVGMVDFLTLFPLSFAEFITATDPAIAAYLRELKSLEPIPEYFFNQLKDSLKSYFISGGMPEAVDNWLQQKDVASLQQIQQNILDAYTLDFSKHADNREVNRIQYIWNAIPSQLARENKKFIYQAVKPGARAREYEDALTWLEQAGLVYRINAITKPGLPLAAYDDLSAFKVYFCDVGLLGRMAGLNPASLYTGNQLFAEFKGALTENFILQSLIPQLDKQPRYWRSDSQAEVDFIIQINQQVIPVEVKSDENVRSKSLAMYRKKYNPNIALRCSMQPFKNYDGLINSPLFLIERILDLMTLNS
jgi:predicted AAA+ superfamily ATPase